MGGSLITHLPEEIGSELLEFLVDHSAIGSKIFISYLGEPMTGRFSSETPPYGLNASGVAEILKHLG